MCVEVWGVWGVCRGVFVCVFVGWFLFLDGESPGGRYIYKYRDNIGIRVQVGCVFYKGVLCVFIGIIFFIEIITLIENIIEEIDVITKIDNQIP